MTSLDDIALAIAAYGLAVVVLPYLLSIFWKDRRLATLNEPLETATMFLGWNLRSFGAAVEENAGTFTVELGRYAAARLRLVKEGESTGILWRPWLTMRGWGTLTWLMLLGLVFPLVAAIIGIRATRSAQAFLDTHIRSRIGADGRAPQPPDELEYLLLRSLSDARRLAATAHESAKAHYSDQRAVIAMVAMLIWMVFVFVNLMGAFPGGPSTWAFYGTTAAAFAFGLGAWGFLRARYLPAIRESGAWARRLQLSAASVLRRPAEGAADRPLFEELAGAAAQVPLWEEMAARARWQRDPVAYWVVFSLSYAAVVSAWGVPAALGTLGTPAGLAVAAFGGVLLFVAWKVARRSKASDERRRDEQRRSWESRRAELERRFDELVGGNEG